MLEGEGDAFWFHIKHEMITANCARAVLQTENKKLLAHRSKLCQTNA
jgi:hypothetical protein